MKITVCFCQQNLNYVSHKHNTFLAKLTDGGFACGMGMAFSDKYC